VTVFLKEEKVSLTERDQDGQQRAELKKTLQKFVKICVKIVGYYQDHRRANEHRRETVRKILTEDLDMRKVCAKWSQMTCSHGSVYEGIFS
jgi:hypothetical protein